MTKSRQNGFSLVEAMVGLAVIIFVITATVYSIRVFQKGSTSIQLRDFVTQDMAGVMEQFRNEAAVDFEGMNECLWPLAGTLPPSTPPSCAFRASPHNPSVAVYASVSDIQANRTRLIVMEGRWKEGTEVRVRVNKQSLGMTRKKQVGATVIFKIVNDLNHEQGLNNVAIKMQGLDTSEVFCVSENGICKLAGVFVAPAVTAAIDGESANAGGMSGFYFEGGEYGNALNKAAYTGTWDVGPCEANKLLDLTGSPIYMHPPGFLKVMVRDYLNYPNPVYGVELKPKVRIAPRQGVNGFGEPYVKIERTTTVDQRTQELDTDGSCTFPSLIPGDYAVFFLGSDYFAALGKPGDIADNLSDYKREYATVPSGGLVTKELTTAKTGGLNGKIYPIQHTGLTTYAVGGSLASTIGFPFNVTLDRINSSVIFDEDCTSNLTILPASQQSPRRDLSASMAWQYLDQEVKITAYDTTPVTSFGSYGIYLYNFFTPRILSNERNPLSSVDPLVFLCEPSDQYNLVTVRPETKVPPPLTPVMVFDYASSPKFIIMSTEKSPDTKSIATPLGAGASLSLGDTRVYANTNSTLAEFNFNLLQRAAFATIKGKIDDGTGKFCAPGLNPDDTTVRVGWNIFADKSPRDGIDDWDELGYGRLAIDSKGYASIEAYKRVAVPVINNPAYPYPCVIDYNMSPFTGVTNDPVTNTHYRALPPNVGGLQTQVLFQARTLPTEPITPYAATVSAVTKVLDGGIIKYRPVAASALNMTLNIVARWSGQSGSTPYFWEANDVSVSAGSFELTTKPGRKTTSYTGQTEPYSLGAGEVVEKNISLNTPVESYYGINMYLVNNLLWAPQYNRSYFSFSPSDSKYHGTIALTQIIKTGKIFGYVRGKGEPLPGTRVIAKVSNGTGQTITWTPAYYDVQASHNACTDISGCTITGVGPDPAGTNVAEYAFDGLYFSGFNGTNLLLEVEGEEAYYYQQADDSRHRREMWENFSARIDILLQPIVTGGGDEDLSL